MWKNAAQYEYDGLNRVLGVKRCYGPALESVTTIVDDMVYNEVGNLQSMNYGNGFTQIFDYDTRNRMTMFTVKDTAGQQTMKQAYTYFKNGNRQKMVENDIRTTMYAYDGRNQLEDVIYPEGTETYAYDHSGNRTMFSGLSERHTYTMDTASDLLKEWNIYTVDGTALIRKTGFKYDNDGNVTQEILKTPGDVVIGKRDMDWDEQGRLLGISDTRVPGQVLASAYVYNETGWRTRKTETNWDGSATAVVDDIEYWYGAGTDALIEHDYVKNTDCAYFMLGSKKAARVERKMGAGQETVEYYHSDILGSSSQASNLAGNVVQESHYKPYGEILSQTGNSTNRYGFTGKERDAQSGLQYFGARYYDQRTGRWWGKDPVVGNTGSILSQNRFLYCENNPIKWIDVDGNEAENAEETIDESHTLEGSKFSLIFRYRQMILTYVLVYVNVRAVSGRSGEYQSKNLSETRYHGVYAGQGYTGGRFQSEDTRSIENRFRISARTNLDHATMMHDKACGKANRWRDKQLKALRKSGVTGIDEKRREKLIERGWIQRILKADSHLVKRLQNQVKQGMVKDLYTNGEYYYQEYAKRVRNAMIAIFKAKIQDDDRRLKEVQEELEKIEKDPKGGD